MSYSTISADKVKGCLIRTGGTIVFRVYAADKSFKDYDILHHDVDVIIDDKSAALYENTVTGSSYLDYTEESMSISADRQPDLKTIFRFVSLEDDPYQEAIVTKMREEAKAERWTGVAGFKEWAKKTWKATLRINADSGDWTSITFMKEEDLNKFKQHYREYL